MLTITKTFPLDFGSDDYTETVYAKCGDTKSRVLEIIPTMDKAPWSLPSSVGACFTAKRADGGKIIKECTVENDGKIKVTLPDEALAVAGITVCEIILTGDNGEVLSSAVFCINVGESALVRVQDVSAPNPTEDEAVSRMTALCSLVADSVRNGEFDGEDGTSCTHSWNGTVLTVTSASGTSSADLKGPKGDDGSDATVTVDTVMSASSSNPVANSTVKAYIDAVKTEIEAAITGGSW